MAHYNKTTPEKLAAQLAIVKHHLFIPKHRYQLVTETMIPALHKKLEDWVKSGDLFRQARVEKGARFIYYGITPFAVDYVRTPKAEDERLKPDPDAPTKDWFVKNGNSTIYKPTLNANYGKQMSLYTKSSSKTFVSGSSLSNFV